MDAKDICDWYSKNCSLQDLTKLDDIVRCMDDIISLDMPFSRMNELANLVFQASAAKEKILEEKLESTKKNVEKDRDAVSRELSDALNANLSEDKKNRIQEKADEVLGQYNEWIASLNSQTANMDSYVTASANNLLGFRHFISTVMSEDSGKQVRAKRINIIDCIPTVNKKIKTASDVDIVLSAIREKLLVELENNDEIDLG